MIYTGDQIMLSIMDRYGFRSDDCSISLMGVEVLSWVHQDRLLKIHHMASGFRVFNPFLMDSGFGFIGEFLTLSDLASFLDIFFQEIALKRKQTGVRHAFRDTRVWGRSPLYDLIRDDIRYLDVGKWEWHHSYGIRAT